MVCSCAVVLCQPDELCAQIGSPLPHLQPFFFTAMFSCCTEICVFKNLKASNIQNKGTGMCQTLRTFSTRVMHSAGGNKMKLWSKMRKRPALLLTSAWCPGAAIDMIGPQLPRTWEHVPNATTTPCLVPCQMPPYLGSCWPPHLFSCYQDSQKKRNRKWWARAFWDPGNRRRQSGGGRQLELATISTHQFSVWDHCRPQLAS